MKTKFDIDEIKKKAEKLEEAKVELKKHFVGIDNIIDEFINSVKIWYILPDVQNRPLIVNLWGMTGIGKTDLVRKFVNFLDFTDRFIEIQMDIDSCSYNNKIQDHIESVLDNSNDPGILLLDEMQRFRTINDSGGEIQNSKYSDLWMLLSDGKFESDSKNRKELVEMLFDMMYYDDIKKAHEKENERQNSKNGKTKEQTEKTEYRIETKYKTWAYSAKRLKKLLKLEESVEEIMTWDEDKKFEVIQNGIKSKNTFEGSVYSKLLVVISGNLDEAFQMADCVGEVDTDADLFHEYSKKINVLTIKKSLGFRFKPEQIARFGNIHIIYPSLSKNSYYEIIRRKIEFLTEEMREKHDICIEVDRTVFEVIYNNGVFPTQGVRPVLSTISSILENSLPAFIYKSLLSNSDCFTIFYKDGFLYSKIVDEEIKYQIPRIIEDIKNEKNKDMEALSSVHESGHAIAYALLFKTSPTQIVSRTASNDTEGFIGCHSFVFSRKKIKERIIVNLSGRVAEEIVFGHEFVSSGALKDIANSTSLASSYIRKLGLGTQKSFISNPDSGTSYNQDVDSTNGAVEQMINEAYIQAEDIVRKNIDFLKETVSELLRKKELKPYEFIEIAKNYGLILSELGPKEEMIESYENKLSSFLSE